VFEQSLDWIAKREIFESGCMGSGSYEDATVSLAPACEGVVATERRRMQ
jgi:hypothetical protein